MPPTQVCVFNPVSKLIDVVTGASVAVGPTAAGRPVVLNQAGLVDPSLTNSGTVAIADTGGLSTGTLVTLYIPTSGPHANQLIAQPATAAHPPLVPLPPFPAPVPNGWPSPCLGFVTAAYLANDNATIYFNGTFIYNDPLSEFSDASIGKQVFLADTNDAVHGFGSITLTAPTPPAEVQAVGLVTNYNGGLVTVEFVPSFPAGVSNVVTFSNILTGTNTGATMTVGTGATLTFSGSGIVVANQLLGVVVSGVPSIGQVLTATSPTAAHWATPGADNDGFDQITTGVNVTATMTVGTGASLVVSGTGVVEATELATTGAAVVVNGSAPPTIGQALVATSATTAAWQTVTGTPGGSPTQIQFNNTGVFGGVSGSSVTADGNVTIAPAITSTATALTVIGDSSADDIVDFFVNGTTYGFKQSGTGAVVLGNVNDPSPVLTTALTVAGSGGIAVSIQDWFSSNESNQIVASLKTSGLINVQGVNIGNSFSIGAIPPLVVRGNSAVQDITQFITGATATPANTKTIWIDHNGNLNLGFGTISGGIFDSANSLGTSGQALTSTGTQVLWANVELSANYRTNRFSAGTVNAGTLGGPYTINFSGAFADNNYTAEVSTELGEALSTAGVKVAGFTKQAAGVGIIAWVENNDSINHTITIHVIARHD